MNSLFVDTSGWASLFIPTELLHPKALQVFQLARQQRYEIVTTNYIIAELVSLLDSRMRAPRSQLFQYVDVIRDDANLNLVHIDPAIDAAAWMLCKTRPDKNWSLVDCTSFVIMEQLGVQQAMTTDQHFEQAGFLRLLKPE
ncbi:MAG: PIN domain-containing protein [Leptolyngbyaceae cyanobacterium bins.349]|nr:PIN domain-containing protein [Leptolyngbyaceae cyanobacterium bins.349]